MSYTLYTYMPNYRAWKALIAAEYNQVKIDVPEFKMGETNKTPQFLEKNPLGKVPVLETPQGSVFESNAIARYVARLRQDNDLFGTSTFESGQVEQWIEFSAHELEPSRSVWLYPIFGFLQYEQAAYEAAKADTAKCLKILDEHLQTRTYLVGHKITLADIVIVSALADLYRLVFSPEFRAPYANLTRWFTTCINQPQFARVMGKVDFAAEEKKAEAASGKQQQQKQQKEQKPKEQKEQKPKEQKPKEQAKPKESKTDSGAGDEEEPKPKKKANPLDALPPSAMIMDNTKRLYFEKRPNFAEFFTEFWGFFDAQGYSIYKSEYQYNSDNRIYFMTQNLVGGWFQRLEELGKYGFGSVVLLGKDEDTAPFVVNGMWIFRGQDVPAEMKECPDSEYHKFTRLDTSNVADRKLIENYFFGDSVEGQKVLDRTYFK